MYLSLNWLVDGTKTILSEDTQEMPQSRSTTFPSFKQETWGINEDKTPNMKPPTYKQKRTATVMERSAGKLLGDLNQSYSHESSPLTLVMLNKLRCHAHSKFSANQITWSRFFIWINIRNDKQCRSRSVGFLEANWSGSTLFSKASNIRVQQEQG